jgi:leader peptidase (prepilin peptidase)/N-methyltransferase
VGEGALRLVVAAWVVAVGAAVGSFLNVVVARLPEDESVVRPRSRCTACRRPIAWYDNLPVVSWVLLRGRCRACGARISPRYVVIEVLGAAAAWLAWQRHGLSIGAAVELAFVAMLLALAAIDLERWELPYGLTRPLLVLGVAGSALSLTAAPTFWLSALGAVIGFGAFWVVRKLGLILAKREAMGVGDLWLLSGLGAYLGAAPLLPVVMLASIQGSLVGLVLMALGKAQPGPDPGRPPADGAWVPPRNGVPFGPFLVLGALEWLYLAAPLAALVPALEIYR